MYTAKAKARRRQSPHKYITQIRLDFDREGNMGNLRYRYPWNKCTIT
jgi:hypothetical protein